MPDDQRPTIGDNNPPDETSHLIERAAELVAAADAWGEITNADAAARLGDFIVQLRESAGDLERAEETEKRPLMVALDAVRAKFRRSRDGVKLAIDHARRLADSWLSRERQRLANEKAEAERQADAARLEAEKKLEASLTSGSIAAEIAAQEAMAEAERMTQESDTLSTRATIRSELSGKAFSQRTTWSAEIIDAKKARTFFLKNPEAVAVFDSAIVSVSRRMAVALKDPAKAPPGIRFVQTTKA